MKWRALSPETRLRRVAIAILVVGLVSAVVIYLAARPPAPNPLGEPEDSKQYLREIQMYGGTANLLATELREWLASLWHGKRLAYTIATLSIVSAAGCLFVAGRLPLEDEDETARAPDGSGQEKREP
ncbi:MAG TPA: hypothetical protein VKJ00_01780 [Thermoanaerobaculia bacterium]|nr:hypothetical protein [Thermoanaerobaculia bacterium]